MTSSTAASEPDPTVPAEPVAAPEPVAMRVEFTGSGAEYLRIWLGNIAITALTLGIGSPWAKVRRERWFHQHLRLAGHGFAFHGSPWAILRGRALAVGLLALTQLEVFGPRFIVIASLALYACLPWLMQRSLRFRLSNTSHRGLRFGFDGSARQAYRMLGGVALSAALLLGIGLAVAYALKLPQRFTALVLLVPLLLVPIALARWRRFAIDHARYGSARFAADFSDRAYALLYLRAAGLWIALQAGTVITLLLLSGRAARLGRGGDALVLLLALGVLAFFYGGWLLIEPWLKARLQNLCWNHTLLAGHWFVSTLPPREYVKMRWRNLALTIATLGLYRPFAVVADLRMRTEALALAGSGDLESVVAELKATPRGGGSEAAEALGLELSL